MFDYNVDLDVTSPLRSIEDIKCVVKLLQENDKTTNIFSVCPSKNSPYFNMVEERKGKIRLIKELPKGIFRRQDAPQTFDMNASIYAWKRETLAKENQLFLKGTKMFIMPKHRSFDIDHPFDFKLVEFLLKNQKDFESLTETIGHEENKRM